MFESLPGADENIVKPATQQPIVQAVRERKEQREAAQRRKDQTTVWDGWGAAQAKGGIGFIDRFITELGYEPQQGYRIPADARKRWESMACARSSGSCSAGPRPTSTSPIWNPWPS